MPRRFNTIFIFLFIYQFCEAQPGETLRRFEFTHGQMGTIFNIICYGNNEIFVKEKVGEAFRLIDSLNAIFSDYIPDSELNRLCRQSGNGNWVRVSEPLYEVVRLSNFWSKMSHGAFDITVGSYTHLWRWADRQGKWPDQNKLKNAAAVVGFRLIKTRTRRREILLKRINMQLDLGGIAKGYTVDKVYALLKANNLPGSLVDGGGDIYAGIQPPDEQGWKIAIQDPDTIRRNIYLSQQSVATSGDFYRYFEYNHIKYSHIIDPKTGLGITVPRTVTVIAPNATQADAIATIISVLGPQSGFRLIRSEKNIKALVIQQEGSGFRKYESGNINFLH